jgi:hypothetical protein
MQTPDTTPPNTSHRPYVRQWHVYSIAELREDGKWGTYCLDCSEDVGNYVYPCQAEAYRGNAPPRVLVEERT